MLNEQAKQEIMAAFGNKPKEKELSMLDKHNEQTKQKILEVFGLSESRCEIKNNTNSTSYTIEPNKDNKNKGKKLLIKEIKNLDIFNQYSLSFKNCSFKCEVCPTINTHTTIKFERCIFKKIVNFNFCNPKDDFSGGFICQYTIFKKNAYFTKSKFNGNVDFLHSHFRKRAFFSESTFKQRADFKEVIFEHNAYFDDVKFLGEVIFDRSEFFQRAHFCRTNFSKFPDFIQTIFDGSINLTNAENTELDISIDSLKKKIDKIFQKREAEGIKLLEYQIASELRNSFRAIKSALIRDNNMLDAHDYEVLEQYCKEIELEYRNSNQ